MSPLRLPIPVLRSRPPIKSAMEIGPIVFRNELAHRPPRTPTQQTQQMRAHPSINTQTTLNRILVVKTTRCGARAVQRQIPQVLDIEVCECRMHGTGRRAEEKVFVLWQFLEVARGGHDPICGFGGGRVAHQDALDLVGRLRC